MKCHLCKREMEGEGESFAFQGAYICRRCAEQVWEISMSTTIELQCVGYKDYR